MAEFPWTQGETVVEPWRVAGVQVRDDVRVMLAADGGRSVAFQLAPAGAGAASASGPFPLRGATVRVEPTREPIASFLVAGRALLERVASAAGGDAGRFLLDLDRPEPVVLHLDELGGSRRRADEILHRALARVDRRAPPLVEILASSLSRFLFEAIDGLAARGASPIRLGLYGPRCLRPSTLGRLSRWAEHLTVQLVLDTLPVADAREGAGWSFRRLARALRALDRARLTAKVTLRLDADNAGDVSTVARLGEVVAACRCEPLQLRITPVERTAGRGRRPVSLAALRPALELARDAPRLFETYSEIGDPLCLFPPPRRRPSGEGVFGERCAGCSLRDGCSGVSSSFAARFGTGDLASPADRRGVPGVDWHAQLRLLLLGRPEATVRLGEVIADRALPPWPCVLPWIRLERDSNSGFGPCCADYLERREVAPADAHPESLWNHRHLQAIRTAMTSGAHPETCRRECPVLCGGSASPGRLELRGGGAEIVEHQIRVVEDVLAGRVEARSPPLELGLAVTSHCNYDCVMCRVERRGPEDQLPRDFYAGLDPWLPKLLLIDANGGEPLASSEFRRFLAKADFARHRHLRLHLTTNGSHLTPKQLARYARIPFSSLTISLNAVRPDTYLAVNRGLPWPRIRENLDALLAATREGRMRCQIRYSMVLVRRNLEEVVPFAELAAADGVGVRFLLPTGNENGESIMTDRSLLRAALDRLTEIRRRLEAAGSREDARDVGGLVDVIESRLASGVLDPL